MIRNSKLSFVRAASCVTLLFLLLQTSCIWKLWSKDKESIESKTFDVYGTVETVDKTQLVIQTKKGPMTFEMVDSSIKGGDFDTGALVHVYYKIRGETQEVTMVVEKVDN